MPQNHPQAGSIQKGVVIRSTGSWYDVRTEQGVIASKVRGKFRLKEKGTTNPIAVGDCVSIRVNDDHTGFITEIHPRHNKLSRRAAGRRVGKEHVIVANVDAALVMQSVVLPLPNPGFVDRFLVMATYHDLEAGIIINKSDLGDEHDKAYIDELLALYGQLGFQTFLISATTGAGIDDLLAYLQDKVTVVAGPSGVGKSTLLNTLAPDLQLPTGEVSQKTKKGRHTTTHAALYPINNKTYLVDTPGIREYGIMEIEPEDLSHFYPEFIPYLSDCRFPNCSHDHEPDCKVKEAFHNDEIHPIRYRNYLSILDSLNLGDKDVGR